MRVQQLPRPAGINLKENHATPLPLDGVLDLHSFHPSDAAELVTEYLGACRAANVLAIRIVHGKGTGVLKRIVRATLSRMPYVLSVSDGGLQGGGWGATLVELAPPGK